ncbi:general substrate transporter [Parathielavia appendiculata]|uniref:General substrate transporter n=1 Tax=Parathielavia appendiculata TaxID=2587402 RepID=A0AAN6Z0Y9_9PEZI|nr:general substrate transporter [Parathielavia appendiculata]
MAFKRFQKGSAEQTSRKPEGPSAAAIVAEQKITAIAVFLGAVASIGGFMFGYVSGQISGFFDMEDYGRRFGEHNAATGSITFSAARQGAIVGLLPAGCLFGSLIAGNIADSLGRRMAISVSALFCCVGNIIEISSQSSWPQFAVGRLVTGLGIGSLSVAVPMYQSESSPAILRGLLISTYQLFITLGIWTAEMINYGTHNMTTSASWRIPNGLSFLWSLILGAGILVLPESPRHAYRKGREDEARRTIARLAGLDINAASVNQQIDDIRAKLDEERAGEATNWYEIFTGPRMLYRTLLGITLMAGQQLTGANFFFYYGTTIFRATGLSDSYVTQIILGSVNVFCTFGGLYVVKKCGRRNALMAGAAWMMVCFLVYSFVGHFKLDQTNPANTPAAGNVLIVFSCLFIVAFATTWGPLVWAVVAELYPAKYRAPAMAIATASNWLFNFLMSFFTRFITDAIDYLYGLVFAGCCAVLVLIVFFFMIESKDRSLEEIDTMYLMHVNPITSSKWDEKHLSENSDSSERQSRQNLDHGEEHIEIP